MLLRPTKPGVGSSNLPSRTEKRQSDADLRGWAVPRETPGRAGIVAAGLLALLGIWVGGCEDQVDLCIKACGARGGTYTRSTGFGPDIASCVCGIRSDGGAK